MVDGTEAEEAGPDVLFRLGRREPRSERAGDLLPAEGVDGSFAMVEPCSVDDTLEALPFCGFLALPEGSAIALPLLSPRVLLDFGAAVAAARVSLPRLAREGGAGAGSLQGGVGGSASDFERLQVLLFRRPREGPASLFWRQWLVCHQL